MNTHSMTKIILVAALCVPYIAQAVERTGYCGSSSRGEAKVYVPCQPYNPQQQQPSSEQSSLKKAQECDVYQAEDNLKAARLKVKKILETGEPVVVVSKRRFDMDTIKRDMTCLAIGAIAGAVTGVVVTYKVMRFCSHLSRLVTTS